MKACFIFPHGWSVGFKMSGRMASGSSVFVTGSVISDRGDCDDDGDIGSITSLQLLHDEVSEQTKPLQIDKQYLS